MIKKKNLFFCYVLFILYSNQMSCCFSTICVLQYQSFRNSLHTHLSATQILLWNEKFDILLDFFIHHSTMCVAVNTMDLFTMRFLLSFKRISYYNSMIKCFCLNKKRNNIKSVQWNRIRFDGKLLCNQVILIWYNTVLTGQAIHVSVYWQQFQVFLRI